MKTIFLIILSLALSGFAQAEEFVYVRSLKADLYSEPAFSAKHLASLPKGTKLVKLKEQDKWCFLQHHEMTGWVPKLLVSATPPRNRTRSITENAKIGSNARRRASAVATAGAARGLAADDRRRKSQDNTTDYSALLSVEETSPSDAEVIEFLEQGLTK